MGGACRNCSEYATSWRRETVTLVKTMTIVERAAKLGYRFDARGLRDFTLIDARTGDTYDFRDADALRDFLTMREIEERELRNRPPVR